MHCAECVDFELCPQVKKNTHDDFSIYIYIYIYIVMFVYNSDVLQWPTTMCDAAKHLYVRERMLVLVRVHVCMFTCLLLQI